MKNLLAICFALLAFSGLAAFGNKSAIGVIAVAVYPEAKRYEPPPPPALPTLSLQEKKPLIGA